MGRYAAWIAGAIFLLNIALKLPFLGGSSLFLDEAVAIYDTQGSVGETIAFSAKDPTPPLYYLTLGLWCKVFGISEASARFPSMLFSAVTAALLFLLGLRHFNVRAGLFAALFFTVSNVGMAFAHEARAYALAGMLMVISYFLFLNIAQDERPGWKAFLGLALVNVLLLFTHYLTSMGLATQAILSLWLLKGKPGRFLRYVGANMLVLGLWLPWVVYNRSLLKDSKVTSWLKAPEFQQLADMFIHFAGGEVLRWVGLGILFIGSIGISYWMLSGKGLEKGGFPILVVAAWLVLSLVLQFMVARLIMPVFELRYVLYALPAYFLLLGAMIAFLPGPRWVQYGVAAVPLGLAVAVFNLNPQKPENWRDAVALVKSIERPGTEMVVSAYYQYVPFAYYYNRDHFRAHDETMDLLLIDHIYLGKDTALLPEVDGDSVTDAILILSHDQLVDPKGELLNYAKSKYCIQRRGGFPGVKVYQFQQPPCKAGPGGHFSTDFEGARIPDEADRIIPDMDSARAGNHVTFVGAGHEFSASMAWKAGEILGGNFAVVDIRLRAKLMEARKKVVLVFVMEHAGEAYGWTGHDLVHAPGIWFEEAVQFRVPEVKDPEDKVKIYVWSPDFAEAYFDDLVVDFWEGD